MTTRPVTLLRLGATWAVLFNIITLGYILIAGATGHLQGNTLAVTIVVSVIGIVLGAAGMVRESNNVGLPRYLRHFNGWKWFAWVMWLLVFGVLLGMWAAGL